MNHDADPDPRRETDTVTTLHVTVNAADALRERTRERIAAAEAGAELDDAKPTLNVGSLEDLARLTRERNVELLAAIARHEPASMREAAALVDRDFKQVHANLIELEALGLVRFEQDGRAKRPVVAYDDLEIRLDLRPDERPAAP